MAPLNSPASRRDAGFAMVALLVGMSVAAIWMAAALPAWRQQAMRQKEEDLIFRGEQYARAIVLFQSANRNALPPSIDVLVSGRYLRKKWKDPITNEEFVPIGNGVSLPGSTQLPGANQAPGRSGQQPGQTPGPAGGNQQGQQQGITGVRSKSNATSIKIYQQQQQHSLWPFDGALIRGKMGRMIQQQGGNQPGRQGGPNDRGGAQPGRGGQGPGGQPGRGGQQVGPGQPGRGGGLDRPAPVGSGGPPGGRGGGSF